MEPFLMLRGQREVGGPPVTVVSEMNLRVQEGKGQRGVELGEGEGVVGAQKIQKHREDEVGEGGVEGGGKSSYEKDQDRQNVTNWEFLEYVPSPNPKRAAEEEKKEGGTPRRRKSGRPAGSVGKKKKSATKRALEEAQKLMESFVHEEKDIQNSSMDEVDISAEGREDEPGDFLFYVDLLDG